MVGMAATAVGSTEAFTAEGSLVGLLIVASGILEAWASTLTRTTLQAAGAMSARSMARAVFGFVAVTATTNRAQFSFEFLPASAGLFYLDRLRRSLRERTAMNGARP